ncbi:MAG: ABC transporter ATP-binding protein [Acidiferrobacteraceae bacterium]|nr:ABC transporter ATP-binding protein [Acidiferrobacteraceae bacterium]|tara:strand:+ start:14236 stop:14955 length:720 start_codon:yes stop_codon:yes gene_type:complete
MDIDILPMYVENLFFSAGGNDILCNLTFQLNSDSKTFIVGPNGAGKTVLLKACHGLLTPNSGRIYFADGTTNKTHDRQGMLFQRPILLRRSVRANIEYALTIRGVHGAEKRERVKDVLDDTGLSSLANQSARTLSLGEQQRLALARVWALKPRILFLDEPTAHLDPSSTRMVEYIIYQIVESGTKIVMTSHDMGQVKRLADEILFLYDGRLVEHSSVKTFFSNPKTEEGKMFAKGSLLW